MPHDPYQALYLHIPFCRKRCSYCDFATGAIPQDSPQIDEYIENLCLDIRRAAKEGELSGIKTVYIGGGTPSYIGQKRLSSLLYMLGVSMNLTPEVEVSMEANPDSITQELVRDIYGLGVNRLSIGVQSFHDDILATLGRIHDSEQARKAVLCALDRFENVSIDLMCGIPGLTPDMFKADLEEAIKLGVTHVSIYPLTIEEGTPFDAMVSRGDLPDVNEEHQAMQMAMAEHILQDAGYERYEVASYAKPGFQCRHNISYWTGVPYLGYGRSAVTMTQNESRRMRVQDGEVVDDLDRRQMLAEDLMMKMRMTRGVSVQEVKDAAILLPKVLNVFRGLQKDGLVAVKEDRYCPTFTGWLLGNELYGRIYELAP